MFLFADIDECSAGDTCGYGRPCENTPGSYRCDCGDELIFNGVECVPVANCRQPWHSTYDHDCPFMSKCVEKEVGYSCECLDNFKMVDGKCEGIET